MAPKLRIKKGQLVRLVWADIRTDLSTEEDPVPLVTINVGCVDEVNRWWVRLKSGWYEDPEFPARDTIVIPRGCITGIEELTSDTD